MKKFNNIITRIKGVNKLTKRRKIGLFGLIGTVLTSAVVLACFLFARNNNIRKDINGGSEQKNTVAEISDVGVFAYSLVNNSGKYNIVQDKYAVITGFNNTALASYISSLGTSVTNYTLKFPNVIIDTSTPGIPVTYPVCEINAGDNVFSTMHLSNFQQFTGTTPSGATFIESVVGIEVGDNCEFISYGAFSPFMEIEEITLPFIGLERGNQANGSDAYKSAFASVFGHTYTLMRNLTSISTSAASDGIWGPTGKAGAFIPGYGPCTTILDDFDPEWQDTSSLGLEAGVTRYSYVSGSHTLVTYFNWPHHLEKVTITSELSVADRAFEQCLTLKEVSISFKESVLDKTGAYTVGDSVFEHCSSLEKVTMPTEVSSLGKNLCASCHKLVECQLPDGLIRLPDGTFYDCIVLEEFSIPHTIEEIGKWAFDGCSSLNRIKSSQQSTYIDNRFDLPEGLKVLEKGAFRDCRNVKVINVPTSVTDIGPMCFGGCIKLVNLTIPCVGSTRGNSGTREALFGYIFGEYGDTDDNWNNRTICTLQDADGSLSDSNVTEQAYFYIPASLTNVTVTNETKYATGAFMNCKGLVHLQLMSSAPASSTDTTTFISSGILYGCTGLETLSIPFVGQSDSIADGEFGWIFGTVPYSDSVACPSHLKGHADWQVPLKLENVEITHQKSMRSYSFYFVTTVKNIIIGDATTYAEEAVFTGVKSLQSLTLPFVGWKRGVCSYYGNYSSWDLYRKNYNGGCWWGPDNNNRNSVNWWFTDEGEKLGHYYNKDVWPYWKTIPSGLTELTITSETWINTYAFRGLRSVKKLEIDCVPDYIEEGCMYDMGSLETLIVPYIGCTPNKGNNVGPEYCTGWFFGQSGYNNSYSAFQQGAYFQIPKSLVRIDFGDEMQTISDYAFGNMTSLRSVRTDANIINLGNYAFVNDKNLSILTYDNATYTKVGNHAFQNCKSLGELVNFVPSTVTEIGHYGVAGTSISIIDIPTYSYLGDGAFANCVNITTADFTGAELTYCGSYLFSGDTHLADVTLTKYLTPYMFQNCTALTTIDLDTVFANPDTIVSKVIPDGLFKGCTNLKDNARPGGLILSHLSSGVRSIGAHAFDGCASFELFYIPETCSKIGNGAFQNCAKLDHLRIPRSVTNMIDGTNPSSLVDDLNNGIFYGCNEDFYLEVYYPSDSWPSGWGYNWNCYYRIVCIGAETSNLFTYEFDPTVKGYLITGLNVLSASNPDGVEFVHVYNPTYKTYLLNGQLEFPTMHEGMYVMGFKEHCFDAFDEELSQVTDLIINKNYIYFGEESLTLKTPGAGNRIINIWLPFDQSDTKPGRHVGSESYYAGYATVMYSDAWSWIGTVPTLKVNAFNYKLDKDSYIYALGKKIKPEIVEVTQKSCIVLTANSIESNCDNTARNLFYSGGYTLSCLDLSNVNINYLNNINVGRATVNIQSNTSLLTGYVNLTFDIVKYELDLFNDSEEDWLNYPEYGGAVDSIFAYYLGDSTMDKYVDVIQYSGKKWSWSLWTEGGYIFNLPEGYRFEGTLTTSDYQAGVYCADKDNTLRPGLASIPVLIGGGFTWSGSYKVYDKNGVNVTNNFNPVITHCVEIIPYEITEVEWPGNIGLSGYYEYEYTTKAIVPVPTVYDDVYGYMNPKFTVSVGPTQAIFPYSYIAAIYTATITGYDTRNFTLNLAAGDDSIQFIVIEANVIINLTVTHVILETENYYSFDAWDTPPANSATFQLSIKGLSSNSKLDGAVRTDDWKKGEYLSSSLGGANPWLFDWDGLGYTITSKVHQYPGTANYVDETSFYNMTLYLKCTMLYNDFKYYRTITEYNYQTSSYETLRLEDAAEVDLTTLTDNHITYGADGRPHDLGIVVTNTLNPLIYFDYASVQTAQFTFTNLGTYMLRLVIKKDKFNDVDKIITLDVVKGSYKWGDLTKEYDREVINPFDALLRSPVDFDQTKFTFEYWDLATNKKLDSAPYQIGNYKVIINTTTDHSAWFNDIVNEEIYFAITRRSIYINVIDTVFPFDSKVYDGYPWKADYNASTDVTLNLLPGDEFTGTFQSRSADVGIYSDQVPTDFLATKVWTVMNPTLGTQTNNYKVVFVGDYEILARTMRYTVTDVSVNYDGGYYTIGVNVIEPSSGYTIYYSDELSTTGGKWQLTPIFYTEPGINTIYIKIVAPTYYTVYDSGIVEIIGRDPSYTISGQMHGYDGYEHGITVTPTDPVWATIMYADITASILAGMGTSDIDYQLLSWDTTCPTHKNIGVYWYAVAILAKNYGSYPEPKYIAVRMEIADTAPMTGIIISDNTVSYDTFKHGPLISSIPSTINPNDLDVFYNIGAGFVQTTIYETSVAGVYTFDLTEKIGVHSVTVLIMCRTYKMQTEIHTVTINPISMPTGLFKFTYETGQYTPGIYYGVKVESNDPSVLEVSYTEINDKLVITTPGVPAYVKSTKARIYTCVYKTDLNGDGVDELIPLTISFKQRDLSDEMTSFATGALHTSLNTNIDIYNNVFVETYDLMLHNAGTYDVEVEISGYPFDPITDVGQIIITKAGGSSVTPPPAPGYPDPWPFAVYYNDPEIIQYLARPVQYSDFNITTIHDGVPTIDYQEYDDTTSPSTLLPGYISAPQDLGHYHVYIHYPETSNCDAVDIDFVMFIVPYELEITYVDEYEYDALPHIPTLTASTGNPYDTVLLTCTMYDMSNPSIIPPVPTEPGTYYIRPYMVTPNPNYVIKASDTILEYKIVNRKITVYGRLTEEFDGNTKTVTTADVDGMGNPLFTISNLLYPSTFYAEFTTNYGLHGIYQLSALLSYDKVTDSYLTTLNYNGVYSFLTLTIDLFDVDDGTGSLQKFYDIEIDLELEIKRPKLDVTYDKNQEVDFDGYYHIPEYTINSTNLGMLNVSVDLCDTTWTPVTTSGSWAEREGGTYHVRISITTANYDPALLDINFTIKKININFTIDPFSAVYDANTHDITYNILNTTTYLSSVVPINLLPAELPEVVYIKASDLEAQGKTPYQMWAFFMAGCPSSLNVEKNLYTSALPYMEDAGIYYAFVYFADCSSFYVNCDYIEAEITRRPIYMYYNGLMPIILWKVYDSYPYSNITLTDFSIDMTPTSPNNGPDAGFVTGQYYGGTNPNSLKEVLIETVSANARGNADGENNGDPYQYAEDFVFQFFPITNGKKENYMPFFEPFSYADGSGTIITEQPLQVTIKRAPLNVFEVLDTEMEYTGYDALCTINTPSDGPLVYFYIECDEHYNELNTVRLYNQSDVGYYKFYCTILTGTNYLGWAGESGDFFDVGATGYAYRVANLRVKPKKVQVIWDEKETVYDGTYHSPNPTFIDALGNTRALDYYITDDFFNRVNTRYMINAGSYALTAYMGAATNIPNPDNYELVTGEITYTIKKRAYTITENIRTVWTMTNWTKTYTEADFTDPAWLPGFTATVKVKTKINDYGTFKNASQFEVEAVVYDDNGNSYYISDGSLMNPRLINFANTEVLFIKDNFQFNLNLCVILDNKEIEVRSSFVDVLYQSQYIKADIEVTSHPAGTYAISYAWVELDALGNLPSGFDEDAIVYSSKEPSFIDVGYYCVYYRVNAAGDTAHESCLFGKEYVRINQRDSFINVSDLDKVYDGIGISIGSASVTGGYNGNTTNLVYEFKQAGEPDSAYTITAPVFVGDYILRVTSTADGDPTIKQNYTPLGTTNNIFEFSITPTLLTFVVNTELVVDITDPTSYYFDSTQQDILTDFHAATAPYYVSGLKGSDAFRFRLTSTTALERGKYSYVNGVPFESVYVPVSSLSGPPTVLFTQDNKFYDADIFNLNWTVYDQLTPTTDMIYNYELKVILDLNVHLKYMTVLASDSTYDYDPTIPRRPFDNLTILDPVAGNYAVAFALSSGTYTLPQSYSVTLPRVYDFYFEVTALDDNYEPFRGKTTITINHKTRDGNLTISDISKQYDAMSYEGSLRGVPDVDWIVNPGEAIPPKSTWKVEYFYADNTGSGGWEIASEAMDSVIEANDYIVRITIPEGVEYGKTVIEKYFKISRITYTISGVATPMEYNGGKWAYSLATNVDGFTYSGLIDITADGTPVNHTVVSGILQSTAETIGVYSRSSIKGQRIELLPLNYVIEDITGKDVTINYEYIIDVTLEITKATPVFTSDIPVSKEYIYTGDYIVPHVVISIPTGYQDRLEYSLDGITWQKNPLNTDFLVVGDYEFYARSKNIPNYNDHQERFTFKIVKDTNNINIADMTKVYDTTPIGYPTIRTKDYFGVADPSWCTFYEEDHVTMLPGRPKNVGTYYCDVEYPTNSTYIGVSGSCEITITPCILNVVFSNISLTYNGYNQCPNYVFTSSAYPTWNLNAHLREGTDYQVSYYDASDTSFASPLSDKPMDVGSYVMVIELLGSLTNKDSTIYNFDFANGLDIVYQPFTISKCIVNISYTAVVPYDAGNPIVIPQADLVITGVPTICLFQDQITSLSGAIGTYIAGGLYNSTTGPNPFTASFKWSSGNPDPLIRNTRTSTNEDVAKNYSITTNISLSIRADVFPYTIAGFDGTYDGAYHSIDFNYTPDPADTVNVYYSVDGGATWSTAPETYINAMVSPAHCIVKVVSAIYGTNIFGGNTADPDYSSFEVMIRKAPVTLDTIGIDMNKVYDDQYVTNPIPGINTEFYNEEHLAIDDLKPYLKYTYYQLDVTSAASVFWVEVDRIYVKDAGKYKVVIELLESDNYLGYVAPDIEFEIKVRQVAITLKNQSMTFNGSPWGALVASDVTYPGRSAAVVGPVPGVSDSGLVPGHDFLGMLYTISANAANYTVDPDDFVWSSGYSITDSATGNLVNLDNYELLLDVQVLINKADFDITFHNRYGIYDGVTYYHITHTWNTYPIYNGTMGSMTIDQYYDQLISYSEISYTSGMAQAEIDKQFGTWTIYCKVEAPNYNTFYGSAMIIIQPNSTEINLDTAVVDKLYTGYPYDDSYISAHTNISGDTRTIYYKYYEFDGTTYNPLSAPPTHVNVAPKVYALTLNVDADPTGTLSAYESTYYNFNILPVSVPVVWDIFDEDQTYTNGFIVYPKLCMYYIGSEVYVRGHATGVRGEDITLGYTVLVPAAPSLPVLVSDTPYKVQAWIDGTPIDMFDTDYVLTNDTTEYYIIPGLPGPYGPKPFPDPPVPWPPLPGPGPGPGPSPIPPVPWPPIPDDVLFEGIEFLSDQYLPGTFTPFTYEDDPIRIEVIYHFSDPSYDYTAVLFLDQTTWDILSILTADETGCYDNSPNCIFYFDFPTDLTTPTFDVTAKLYDKTNTRWNTDGDIADITITVHLDPKKLSPNPGPTQDIRIELPIKNSFDYTGSQIEYDNIDPDQLITLYFTNGTPGDPTDDTIVPTSYYTIYYGNNINVTPNDGDPTTDAYFIVKSNTGCVYEFSFGDYDAYDAAWQAYCASASGSGTPIDYDYMHKTCIPSVAANSIMTFEIYSPEPTTIHLADTASIKFVQYEQDFVTNGPSGVYPLKYTLGLSNDDRDTAIASLNANQRREATIKLSYITQTTTMKTIMDQLVNSWDRLAIYTNDMVTCLYDGQADKASGYANCPDNPIDSATYICTGYVIVLYDKDDPATRTAIDEIEIVIVGDTNGDGYVTASDGKICSDNATDFMVNGVQADTSIYQTAYYLAGLCADLSTQNSFQSSSNDKKIKDAATEFTISGTDIFLTDFYV